MGAGKSPADRFSLRETGAIESNVDMALDSMVRIPVSFAVAYQDQFSHVVSLSCGAEWGAWGFIFCRSQECLCGIDSGRTCCCRASVLPIHAS